MLKNGIKVINKNGLRYIVDIKKVFQMNHMVCDAAGFKGVPVFPLLNLFRDDGRSGI
jgi:hypothetical protein